MTDSHRNEKLAKKWNDVDFSMAQGVKNRERTAKIIEENKKKFEDNPKMFDREARRDEIAECMVFGDAYPEWFETIDYGARTRIDVAAKSVVILAKKMIVEEEYKISTSISPSLEASAKSLVDTMISELCNAFRKSDGSDLPTWFTELEPDVKRMLLQYVIFELSYKNNRRGRK